MIHRDKDWLAAQVGDELVMMSATKGNYLALSEVGARIWQLIEQPQGIDSLCATLIAEYDVEPETCRAEVEAFVETLAANNAIRIDADT
jgi:hypothetical protein